MFEVIVVYRNTSSTSIAHACVFGAWLPPYSPTFINQSLYVRTRGNRDMGVFHLHLFSRVHVSRPKSFGGRFGGWQRNFAHFLTSKPMDWSDADFGQLSNTSRQTR